MEARPLVTALAVATALALNACGSATTVTRTVTVTEPAHGTAAVTGTADAADTSTTTASPGSAPRAPSSYKSCDANVRAKRVTTTCGFAENAFYAYFIGSGATGLRVYSPATGRTFTTRCSRGTATITCRTSDGGVKFPQAAIAAYSDDQASAFAAAHEVGDSGATDTATAPSSPSSSDDDSYDSGNTYSNPYDSPDTTVDNGDDPAFCDTHDCIPNYPNGNGSTVQCADGSYSHSGGVQGACSHHGGVG
jgi:hypothetical protein